ncbi:helix-turn-helix transcriptional regulator [Streptomyces sp. NPDC047042]|uniref:helix-turn-helix domain-containing protein n=1 Tax=Streptomyces sp. NPDC047042 TaxID=3154807 RepID=UPI0033FC4AD9
MPLDPLPDWLIPRRREVGARLRAARDHANLTQMELGNRVGRDHRTIHRWEHGYRVPTLDDLLLLADALGIQPREFFE